MRIRNRNVAKVFSMKKIPTLILSCALLALFGVAGVKMFAHAQDGDFDNNIKQTIRIKDEVNGSEKTEYYSGEKIPVTSLVEISGDNSIYRGSYILVKVPKKYLANKKEFDVTSAVTSQSESEDGEYYVKRMNLSDLQGGSLVGTNMNFWLKNEETPAGYNFDIIQEYHSQDGTLLSKKTKTVTTLKNPKGISSVSKKYVNDINNTVDGKPEVGVVKYKEGSSTDIDESTWATKGIVKYRIESSLSSATKEEGRSEIANWVVTDRIPENMELTEESIKDGWSYNPLTNTVSRTVRNQDQVHWRSNSSLSVDISLKFKNNTPASVLGKDLVNNATVEVAYTSGEKFSKDTSATIVPVGVAVAKPGVTAKKVAGTQWDISARQVGDKYVRNLASINSVPWDIDSEIKSNGNSEVAFAGVQDFIFDNYYKASSIELNTYGYKTPVDSPFDVYIVDGNGNSTKVGEITSSATSLKFPKDADIKKINVVNRSGKLKGLDNYHIKIRIWLDINYETTSKAASNGPFNLRNTAKVTTDQEIDVSGDYWVEDIATVFNNRIGSNNGQIYKNGDSIRRDDYYYYIGQGIYNTKAPDIVKDFKLIYTFPKNMEFSDNAKEKILSGKWKYISDYKNTGKSAVVMNEDFATLDFLKVGPLVASGDYEVEMISIWNQNDTKHVGSASDDLDFHNDGNTTSKNVARSKVTFHVDNPVLVGSRKDVKSGSREDFWSTDLRRAKAGEMVDYRMSIINYSSKTLTTTGMLDVLPYTNDKSIVEGNDGTQTDRGSQFWLRLTGPVENEQNNRFNITYSTEQPGSTADESYAKTFVEASAITDWSKVRMIKIEQKPNTEISAQESISFIAHTKIDESAKDSQVAVNTAAVKLGVTRLNEGNKTTVTISDDAVIKGIAFKDKNRNSEFDKNTDELLGGYKVKLMKGDKVIAETTTANDGSYEIRTRQYDNGYTVKFEKPAGDDNQLVDIQSKSDNTDFNNKSNIENKNTLTSYSFDVPEKGNKHITINIGLYKPAGTVKVKYESEAGLTLKDTQTPYNEVEVGTSYSTSPDPTIIKDGLSYTLTDSRIKTGSAAENGTTIDGELVVTYLYKPILGKGVTASYRVKGTETKIIEDKQVSPDGLQVGTKYTATSENELTDANGLVYVKDKVRASSDPESGTIEKAAKTVIYDYVPKAGGSVIAKIVDENGRTLLPDTTVKATGTQVGTKYSSTPQSEIVVNGITYVYTKLGDNSAAQDGAVDTTDKVITYVYKPKKGGQVVANYIDEAGNSIANTKVVVNTDTPVGTSYTDKQPNEITSATGLEFTFSTLKSGSAPQSGTVKASTQEITYVYTKKAGESVVAKFVDEKGNTIIADKTIISKGTQSGTSYNTKSDKEITDKNGLVYTFKEVKNGSAPLNGKSNTTPQEITFVYSPKEGAEVIAKFVDENGQELKDSVVVAKKGTQVGTKYNSDKDNEITKDGLVYVYEKLTDKSVSPSGVVTTKDQAVIYQYSPKKGGSVIAKFVDKNGKEITSIEIVKAKDTQVGTPYSHSRVEKLVIDGRTFILKKVNGNENGKVSEGDTVIEYVYEPEDISAPNTGIANTIGGIITSVIAIAIAPFTFFFLKKRKYLKIGK